MTETSPARRGPDTARCFYSGGRLFVEQIALYSQITRLPRAVAPTPLAERSRMRKRVSLRDPFAVRRRERGTGVACAIAYWLHEVAHATA